MSGRGNAAHGATALYRREAMLEHGPARRAWSRAPSPAERAEFERFYQQTRLGLVVQQHALCGDRTRAEATVREAYVRAWLAWPAVRAMADAEAWVRRTADRLRAPRRHRANGNPGRPSPGRTSRPGLPSPERTSAARTPRHRASPPYRGSEPIQQGQRTQLAVLVRLGQLPSVQRRMLVLRYLAGLGVERLAEEEGATVQAIRLRLTHGQLELASGLAGHPQHPDLARWRAAGRLDEWTAQELTRLAYRLALGVQAEPVDTAFRRC